VFVAKTVVGTVIGALGYGEFGSKTVKDVIGVAVEEH
jgi:hypothetical protein